MTTSEYNQPETPEQPQRRLDETQEQFERRVAAEQQATAPTAEQDSDNR